MLLRNPGTQSWDAFGFEQRLKFVWRPGEQHEDSLVLLFMCCHPALSPASAIPLTLRYEPGAIVADGDFVIVHGRFSGFGQPVNWIAADILRVADGVMLRRFLAETPAPA